MLHLMVILSYPSPCSKLLEVFYVRHGSLSLKSQAATAFMSSCHWTVTGPWFSIAPLLQQPEARNQVKILLSPQTHRGEAVRTTTEGSTVDAP